MTTAEVRAALARTGILFTQVEGDVGHISAFWRRTILALCEAFDELPRDAAELLRHERQAHEATKVDLAKALAGLEAARQAAVSAEHAKSRAEEARREIEQLVVEAIPRMRTLNNAMSPGWLKRASALLGE